MRRGWTEKARAEQQSPSDLGKVWGFAHFYAHFLNPLRRPGGLLLSVSPATFSWCRCGLRPGFCLRRHSPENGVCAFKAPDCLSLCAARRLTPSGHSGHCAAAPNHPGEVQRANRRGPSPRREAHDFLQRREVS